MSMGLGMVHCKSSKQKLNTKSSTESEIVGLSDYVPYHIWFANFMKEQGYKMERNVIYQDNQSAMKMEINGRNSCTGNSRHIDIRYFFTKDRVNKGEFKIEYCPTHRMVADYFTKPKQGRSFKFMRDIIMGYVSINELSQFEPSPIKERVGHTSSDVIGDGTKLDSLNKANKKNFIDESKIKKTDHNIIQGAQSTEKEDSTKVQEKFLKTYARVVRGK